MKKLLLAFILIPSIATAQEWYADDIPGYYGDEVIPIVPNVPAPPNYYGLASGAYRNGYTVTETERTQFDPYRAATGFMDPFYKQKTYQVVPNNSDGAPIQPGILGK